MAITGSKVRSFVQGVRVFMEDDAKTTSVLRASDNIKAEDGTKTHQFSKHQEQDHQAWALRPLNL
jgi:hypothetical protein